MLKTPCRLIALAAALLIAACARQPFEEQLRYRDERLVTTRPADAGEGAVRPDVLVHLERLNVHGMSERDGMPRLAELPPDATLILAAESLASYGSPFYATVQRPRGRVELGGKVVRLGDGTLRVELDHGESGPGVVHLITTSIIVRPDDRVVVSKTSDGIGDHATIREVTILRVSPLATAGR
jgi:hypothetical protein